MAANPSTKKQARQVQELDEIYSIIGLEYWGLEELTDEERRARFRIVKDQTIRSEVLMKYVVMDELLSAVICWDVFGKKKTFVQLWRTKKFQAFNYFILEKLYLIQKLELVRFLHKIPKTVVHDLYGLNDIRNALAHSFFPENRRSKPSWKGKDISTIEGLKAFTEDIQAVIDFFLDRFWSQKK